MHLPTSHHIHGGRSVPRFTKWRPSELMEWAKSGYPHDLGFNLTRSGIPLVESLGDIPGGPYVPSIVGGNYAGHEGLKEIVAGMYGSEPENVLLAAGASQCNFLLAGALLSDGGTVVVETPFYQPILRSIEVWADQIVRLPRRPEDNFQPDPTELQKLITRDTKFVMLTNLHNPSHVALETDRLKAIVHSTDRVGAEVVLDEVYLRMFEPDFRHHGYSFGGISISSLGKTWGLDPLRVGWAIGPAEHVHRAYRLNNLLGVNQSYVSEDLAYQILSNKEAVRWLHARAETAAAGRKYFAEFLTKAPHVRFVEPNGGVSAIIQLPNNTDDLQFTNRLIEERDTAVFPCSFHDMPSWIRLSFGGEEAEMREGLARVAAAINELS